MNAKPLAHDGHANTSISDNSTSSLLSQAFAPDQFESIGKMALSLMQDCYQESFKKPKQPVFPYLAPQQQLQKWAFLSNDAPKTLEAIFKETLAGTTHLHHPANMGHQVGVVLPLTVWCDAISSYMNNGTGVYEMGPVSTVMEMHCIKWMAQKLDYPNESDGFLTSGGSLGNLTALLAARQVQVQQRWGVDAWKTGAQGHPPLAILASETLHYCMTRVVRMMGWGEDGLISIPCDASYRMDVSQLDAALKEAGAKGRTVIGVVGNACCTATGAFDDLEAIAAFCQQHQLWFHVDGAHGASAILSQKYKHHLNGIEQADSVVWDAHKLMMMPALITGILFKNPAHQVQAFDQEASYLFASDNPAEGDETFNLAHRTFECTKKMMSFKLWTALQVYGDRLFEDYIDRVFNLSRTFYELIQARPDFQVLCAPESNILCFRYTPDGASNLTITEQNALQGKIRQQIIQSGAYYFVQTQLKGVLYLRTTLMNPFTTEQHLKGLLHEIANAGQALLTK
jgi:L-2,4-diaminobutyrate decarboxylase